MNIQQYLGQNVQYYAQGPITNNSHVYIVGENSDKTALFFLNANSLTGALMFYPLATYATPFIYSSVSGNQFTLSLADGYVGPTGLTDTPTYLTATSGDSTDVLVGIRYQLSINGTALDLKGYNAVSSSPCTLPKIDTTTIVNIPVVRFVAGELFMRHPDGSVNSILDRETILSNEFNWWHMARGCAIVHNGIFKGYSRRQDAQINSQITPCPQGISCGGVRGCYGPCEDPRKSCVFSWGGGVVTTEGGGVQPGTAVCKFNTTVDLPPTPTVSWWFWGIILLIVLVSVILLYFILRRQSTKL